MKSPKKKPTTDWTSLNYNATLGHFAQQLGIKLWQAMAMMKYAELKDKRDRTVGGR